MALSLLTLLLLLLLPLPLLLMLLVFGDGTAKGDSTFAAYHISISFAWSLGLVCFFTETTTILIIQKTSKCVQESALNFFISFSYNTFWSLPLTVAV